MPRNQPSSPSPPPPASFPFTSGGFDFPSASSSPPPAARPRHILRSRLLLTDFLDRRWVEREILAAGEREDEAAHRQPPPGPARRRLNRPLPRHAEREPGSTNQRRPTMTPVPPRDSPSARYLSGSRSSRRDRSPVNELDSQPRQPKRRKLDHEPAPASEYDGFKYGYKGQIARGRLRMEVFSCDGGEYESDSQGRLYKVQNVLSNDKSVYCSESASCNLLLKHIGEAPFCLERIVIRAPDRGFTAPVQEGLIFVAMSSDQLLSGTSAYQIEYNRHGSASPTPSLPDDDNQLLSFQEAMQDPQIWDFSRQAVTERIGRLRLRNPPLRTRPTQATQGGPHEDQQSADDDDGLNECPYHIDEEGSTAAGISAPTPPPFTTTTESEQEDSDENEALPSAAVMADRLRRESRWRPDSDEDDDADDDDAYSRFAPLRRAQALENLQTFGEARWAGQRQIDPIRATRLHAPSRIEPKESRSDTVIAPHARFFIARHKNKITIKFHPAM